MATPASDEVDAAMRLLDQEDEGVSEQPSTANPTAEQLTAGLNRLLNDGCDTLGNGAAHSESVSQLPQPAQIQVRHRHCTHTVCICPCHLSV